MPRDFMPGSKVHDVPGIGTFAVFGVANGHGSQGLQVQYMPEGGSEHLLGVLSYMVEIANDRTPSVVYVPPGDERIRMVQSLHDADPKVVAAGLGLAKDVLAKDQSFVLFNVISSTSAAIRAIEKDRDDAGRRADWRRRVFAREEAAIAAGGNEPRTCDASDVEKAEHVHRDVVARTEARLAMLTTLRKDMYAWSHVAGEKPSIHDLIADRDAHSLDDLPRSNVPF